MPIVTLILLALVSTAQAVVPFRLVTEIQLPARTIQWDVQHYEDSTSFGWVAITEGAPILGYDEEIDDDTITVSAQDTFWFKSNLDDELDYMLFSREGFNYLESPLQWEDLTLLRWPDHEGPIAVCKALHYFDEDIRLYFLDLLADSIFATYHLSSAVWSDQLFDFHSISPIPALPATTQRLVVSATNHTRSDHSGWSVSRYDAGGQIIAVPSLTGSGFGSYSHQALGRTGSFGFVYRSGHMWYYSGCDECPEEDFQFSIGIGQYSDIFSTVVVDTFSTTGRVLSQEDLNGTNRILYSNGNCYDASSGEVVFTNPLIIDTTLAAYVRVSPGEDFLAFNQQRFDVYDGRLGTWVDSTSIIQGLPQYRLARSGFDDVVSYDAAQKIVRVYKSFTSVLSIRVNDTGQVELSWTPSAGAVGYRLDSSSNSDFTAIYSDFYDASTTSTIISPNAPIKFFRVTPLFE